MTQEFGFEVGPSEVYGDRLEELLDRLELQETGTPAPWWAHRLKLPQSRQNSMILAFRIPEAPYSDEAFERLHKFLDVIEGVHATLEIFGVEVAPLLGVALGTLWAAAGPIAGLLGVFMALGVGYAQARADVAKWNVKMGFAYGVVTGADDRKWSYVKSRFWKQYPEANIVDPEAGRIAQRAFNLGLVTGFVQGRKLTATQRKFLWTSIGRTLTEGDRKYYAGPTQSWGERLWMDWYIKAATTFIRLYVKD